MNQFSNQLLENIKIVLPNDKMNYLGHNLVIKNCELIIETSAKGLVIADVQFFDSKIKVKNTLKNFRWHGCDLSNCVVEGKFNGNDFGIRDFGLRGIVRNCDFSAAVLDGCRFFDCDTDTIKFPSWPCIAIKKPLEQLQWLRETENGKLAELVDIYEDDGLNPDMIVEYAPSISKESGIDLEILKRVFE